MFTSGTILARLGLLLTLLILLGGCAAQRAFHEGEALSRQGRYDEAVIAYTEALKADPARFEYRARLTGTKAKGALMHLQNARSLRAKGDLEGALREYSVAVSLDTSIVAPAQEMKQIEDQIKANQLVEQALEQRKLRRNSQAKTLLEQALQIAPDHKAARELLRELKTENMTMLEGYELDTSSTDPITLKFKDAKVKDVFKILSHLSGINFIFDEGVDAKKITVFLEDSTFTQALELIMKMNDLAMRVLNPKTVIVYPKTKDKEKQYEDQIIQTFYLSNIDAKKAVNLLRTMLQLRKIYVHEELNALVIRDSAQTIQLAQQILEAADRSDAEVLYALELIEVSHTDDFKLGPKLDSESVTFGFGNDDGTDFISGPVRSLGNRDFLYTLPTASFDIQKKLSDTEILANPMVRVKNGAKAKVHVGSREPIVTTTNNANGDVTSTNIQYVDVGVKLDLEAKVQLDDTVLTKVTLEVSNKGATVPAGDNVAFAISTTNAQSELVLKDGERTILGGLIREDDSKASTRLPLIGRIPLIGDLLASHSKNKSKREILLSITPHIVKKIDLPKSDVATLWSGGEDDLKAGPTLQSFAMVLDAEQNMQPPSVTPAVIRDDEMNLTPIPAEPGASAVPEAPAPATTPSRSLPQAPQVLESVPEPVIVPTSEPVTEETIPPGEIPAQGANTRAFLNGPSLVDVGQEFALTVQIDEITRLFSAPLFIKYDPELLNFVRIDEGSFLRSDGSQTVLTSSPNATQGRIIVGYKQAAGGNGASGSGDLYQLVFEAKAPGKAVVTLDRVNFRDPEGNRLAVNVEGTVVEVR